MTTDLTTLPHHAVVTGGANGLGREFCLALAREGARLAIVDIDRAAAEQTCQMVAAAGGEAQVEIGDVTNLETWIALRSKLQAAWPRLDLLVNNAGMYAAGFVGDMELAVAERLLRLNLHSVLYGCHVLTPWLVASARSQPAAVINVASSFAFLCPPGMAPYNLSKAAVVALSETLRGELKHRGVHVTVVCPGPLPTRFIENASFASDALRHLTESYVRKSRLAPADVATAALAASRRGELYVVLGSDQRWYWRLKRWLPLALLSRVARRTRKDLSNASRQTT